MSATMRAALALIGVAAVFAAWFFASHVLQVDPTIVPPPESVLSVLSRGVIGGSMDTDILFTLYGAGAGFVAGSAVAFVAGIIVSEFPILNRFVYPVVLGAQSMPTIALAPLLSVWLGIDIGSKIALVGLGCFFPVFLGTVGGLNAGNADLRDLYRVYSAGRLRTLWELKLPGALHYIFASLQVAVVVSLIVCVVGEFVSSVHGLGHLIKALSDQLDVSTMFAAIVLLAVIGAIASALCRFLHRRVVFWDSTTAVQSE
jgi:NitT/TauT family transport system permease protein